VQTNPRENPWSSLDTGEDENSLDIGGFIRRRKSFVIVLAILGTGIGYLLFQNQVPRYRSGAWLEVIHRSTDKRLEGILGERTLSDAEYEIASPKLLLPAYEKNELGQLATLRGLPKADALARMKSMLNARELSANVLEISCEGSNPDDTAVIANAVAEEYVRHQLDTYSLASTELNQLLVKARDQYSEDIEQVNEEYGEFLKSSRLLTDGSNPHSENLNKIRTSVSQLVIKQAEVKAELLAIEEAMRVGGQKEALLLLVGKDAERGAGSIMQTTDSGTNARTVAQTLFPLLMEEALLSQQVGADHPKLITLRKQIEVTRQHFDSLAGLTPDRSSDSPRPDFLTIYMQSLRQEMVILERQRTEFEAMATQEEIKARQLVQDENENRTLLSKQARLETMYNNIAVQIGEIEVNQGMGGISAQVLTEARNAVLVFPSLTQFIGLGGFLGGFLGLVIGYIVEVADRSFRKPEEIVREFGVPIIGHIPYMKEQRLRTVSEDAVMDRTVVTAHLPRSRPSEAYRSVRTAICFSAMGKQHRILQVTSPAAGDGKSTLAANLAVSLAQSGKKTLLVESDFRRPKVHKMTGVSNKIGIVDLLRGQAELVDAVQSTDVEDFFVLPCGSRPRNPSEMLTRPDYEALLQVLREKFEYVVVDTPPVLVVTDPCSVAPRADSVIICMRLSRHTRDFGRRTMEQLRDVGANIGGIAINGVEESDAYGYGSYNYSDYRNYYRGYRYQYNYKGYGSGDGREGYFSEDGESTPATPLISSQDDSGMKIQDES
jgi:capsular exopolysaccharide synthesis family protein